ncbi:MAG: cupin domain-containing protein [Thermoleophilia bacterium]
MPEAPLVRRDGGLVPRGPGWFVVNAREARWHVSDRFGRAVKFEGDEPFAQVGLNVRVLEPGEPACLYHGEESEEHFLVVAGECLLLIEGEERRLGPWDFVHCPPWVEHVLVGAGSGPCVLVAVGGRPSGEVRYPAGGIAEAHGAAAAAETDDPAEAYGPSRKRPAAYRPGDLPG